MTSDINKPPVILLARVLPFEDSPTIEKRLYEIAKASQLNEPYIVLRGRVDSKRIAIGSILVFDHPIRIADDLLSFIKISADLLKRDCRLIRCDSSQHDLHDFSKHKELILFLSHLPQFFRSTRIKTALHTRKQCGFRLGRASFSQEIREQVLSEYKNEPRVRTLTRKLNQAGIQISRSSIHRIIKKEKEGGS